MAEQQPFDSEEFEDNDIAIVGIACRFPDAENPRQYWQNLQASHESRTVLSDEELIGAGVTEELLNNPNYVKSGMFLQGMENFDAGFFGFSPRDAAIMDPQHRLFLENCWEALENAGHTPEGFDGSIGVFGGSGHNAYMPYNLLSNPELVDDVGFFLLRHTGNDKDFLTTRVSYCLNLSGPSINVQTACSTSLVATHTACQSLLAGECDMALAGGVTVELPSGRGYLYQENEILSADGHCRPFDANSDGTVFGSGVGVIVLRRLHDALADGDTVQAVIRASAINNDGAGKVSYLAPSVDGQAAVITEALEIADIDPQSVALIECHGTGTRMGDPIEVEALSLAYNQAGVSADNCALGSVKSNIGHLDTAAGVAGIIKVVQSLKHKKIPPTLHYQQPNPAIDFAGSRFYVNNQLLEWPSEQPRRAGVSSLGVGGTNAHIILEEAPPQQSSHSRQQQLLVLSARSRPALDEACKRYAEHLKHSQQPLADIAFTASEGRRAFPVRCCVSAASSAELSELLLGADEGRLFFETAHDAPVAINMLFAGGGAQYPNMGLDLYTREPVYREAVDECLALADEIVDFKLGNILFPAATGLEQATLELERPSRALPALFISQYAQARLWQSWGVIANAYIGHSMGEYTAACLSGVFSARDALAIVARRGQLFEQLEPGAMLSVMMAEAELQSILASYPGLSIAAINGPELCVASGPVPEIDRLTQQLEATDVACQRLHISVAAHSCMLDSIMEEFRAFLQGIDFSTELKVPVASNLTGDWLTGKQASDPGYWVQHLRQSVRYADGLSLLLEQPGLQLLLEVGPGNTLVSAARQHQLIGKAACVVSSMRHARHAADDQAFMLTTLGRLWGCGAVASLQALYQDQQRLRVELPTYPFEHQPYWIKPGNALLAQAKPGRQVLDKWFYQPYWKPEPLVSTQAGNSQLWIWFGNDKIPLFAELASAAGSAGHRLIAVTAAADYRCLDEGSFELDPSNRNHYDKLFDACEASKAGQLALFHGWSLAQADSLDNSFYPLLAMSQAVSEQGWDAVTLCILGADSLSMGPGDTVQSPLSATMLGASRVLSHELPGARIRYIDLKAAQIDTIDQFPAGQLARQFLAELGSTAPVANQVLAYRNGQRYAEAYTDVVLDSAPLALHTDGCYLISGGLGGLGLKLAQQLASSKPGVKLLLLGRTALPATEDWDSVAKRTGRDAARVRSILELEASGAVVQFHAVDITDGHALADVISRATHELGAVRGVFHTAGLIDDALLGMKTPAQAARVLAPKIQGTLALAASAAAQHAEFMVLYSSTSAITGLAGQFDYAAANAFMDAFASAESAHTGVRISSVNWSAWQEVGMAAELADGMRYQGTGFESFPPTYHAGHYRQCFSTSDWLLDDHRTKAGLAVMPGTGFIEIIRAAIQASGLVPAGQVMQLREVFFLSPLNVRDGEQCVVDVTIDEDSRSFSLRSASSPENADNDEWLAEHVQGQLEFVPAVETGQHSIADIRARCQSAIEQVAGSVEHEHMAFGERWACLQTVSRCQDEVLAELQVPEQFSADLDEFLLHPGMLDMAIGAGFRLATNVSEERDFFVPLSYGSLSFFHPLQAKILSRVKLVNSKDDRCYFDIDIMAEDGSLLVAIKDFVVKQMAHEALDNEADGAMSALRKELEDAIRPEEGQQVIQRVLSHPECSQVIVSPFDFQQRFVLQGQRAEAGDADSGSAVQGVERPALASGYEAPESEMEKNLAGLWQSALGIADVGVNDNFFELGGHSLMLTQLVSKGKKQFGLQVSMSKLFDKPTIKNWIEFSGGGTQAKTQKAVSPIKRVSREGYKAKR